MNEIILFKKALNISNVDFAEINKVANKKGCIVHPDCCNTRVLEWLDTLPKKHNSTFYKTWKDVVSKDRIELFFDQIRHYASTYGTDFKGEPYVPNENPVVVSYETYQLILPISKEEIKNKIQGMFCSGIAMSNDTINMCFELINELGLSIESLDVDSIKNKEVMMIVCDMTGKLPTKPEEMVRFLVYKYTKSTLLIKSRDVIALIKSTKKSISPLISSFGYEKLSSVFYRFKPLFLAMKKGNEKAINKLRKLAIKNHKPYSFGYFEQILSGNSDLSKIDEKLKGLNNFKKVLLLQTIKIRQKQTGVLPIIVRNQKIFVKEHGFKNMSFYDELYKKIYKSLIDGLSKKACTVKLSKNIKLALPTSEKSFVGNIPFGSYVKVPKSNAIVGIHWKGTEGALDLDLSYVDINGSKVGWNSNYYNDEKSIVYSGDMTSASPEAVELLYCKKGFPEGVVRVNAYCAKPNSKVTLFFAKTKDGYKVEKNCMVNPNEIVFSEKMEMKSKEMMFGVLTKNKFTFSNIRTGSKIVSHGNSVTSMFISHAKQTSDDCFLKLKDVLKDAGFTFTDNAQEAKIDLSVFDKSSLINLLA